MSPGSGAGAGAVLAQLIAQGCEEGAGLPTLRGIAEEAGEVAASRALARLGLTDEAAAGDMRELRDLLGAWRDAKKQAWKAVFGWIAAAVLGALAVKLGFAEWVR